MAESVRVLTAKQAEIAKTALAFLAMRLGGESPEVAGAMKALSTQVPDPRAEVKRLRAQVESIRAAAEPLMAAVSDPYTRAAINSAQVFEDAAAALRAALGDVPTDG